MEFHLRKILSFLKCIIQLYISGNKKVSIEAIPFLIFGVYNLPMKRVLNTKKGERKNVKV